MAGISCACELIGQGIGVTLFEAARSLGGRVTSFADPETGIIIDNCQHVLLGCCTEAANFLKRIGSLEHVRFHGRLNIIDNGTRLTIEASRLPPPLHLLPSIVRSSFFSRRAKADLYTFLPAMLLREAGKSETARDYLCAVGCGEELFTRLVEPVIVSALNEKPNDASARYARMVLMESLVKNRRGYRLGVPELPQYDLIGKAAQNWLESNGCEIRLLSRVVRVNREDGRARWLELASGERLVFDAIVAAVPPHALPRLGLDAHGGERLGWRPIVSVHLIYDRPMPPLEPACVVGKPFGWVFSKRPNEGYVEVVGSAAGGLIGQDNDELIALARRSAAAVDPEFAHVPIRRGIVCRMRRATFATLACDIHRPAVQTFTPNLFLAGDWTNTAWPATIESAVRSGRAAAKALLEVV